MVKHKEYSIPFSGLKQGKHSFEYVIEKKFFDSFGYDEFNDAHVPLKLQLLKTSTVLELEFTAKGMINVDCDLTSEPFDQPVFAELELVVKFGDAFNDEDDEILILPHGEHQVNVAQYIYEMLVLAVPHKRIHPGIADGTLQSKALDKLAQLQPKETRKDKNENDPTWDKLKGLLTDK